MLATAVASGCATTRPLNEIDRPVYVWNEANGLCGRTLAIDRDGHRWVEGGCENGAPDLERTDTELGARELHALAARAAALPPPTPLGPSSPSTTHCRGRVHRFIVMPARGANTEWLVCANDVHADYEDPRSVPEPLHDFASAFVQRGR